MTRVEERLRSAFGDAARTVSPDTLRPLSVPAPNRHRGERWIAPLVAAAAVGTLAVGTAAVLDHGRAHPAAPARPGVRAAERGVVRITATAPRCRRRLEGTGFVYAPGRVMTAAHVVAGSRGSVEVSVPAGRERYRATVVVYDPRRDVAVLSVPGLRAPALTFTPAAAPGTSAVIREYAQGTAAGTAMAVTIRARVTARGPDIYQSSQVSREIFSVRTPARAAAVGGPLLATDGTVYGLVFAASLDDPHTAYALTAEEIAPDVRAGRTADQAVSTQSCAG